MSIVPLIWAVSPALLLAFHLTT